jgi:hypothetical protein
VFAAFLPARGDHPTRGSNLTAVQQPAPPRRTTKHAYPCSCSRVFLCHVTGPAPGRFRASPYLGAPQPERTTLLFHRGRMGEKDGPAFSRGVRQKVCAAKVFADLAAHGAAAKNPEDALGGLYSGPASAARFGRSLHVDVWSRSPALSALCAMFALAQKTTILPHTRFI